MVDEGGNLLREVGDGALHLSDELQESRHHTESDGAAAYAHHAPEEGGGVSAHKTEDHGSAGHDAVFETGDRLVLHVFLQQPQPGHHPVGPDQGQHDDALLEVFLHQLLDLRLLAADALGLPAQLAEKHTRAHDGGDHQDDEHPNQVRRHKHQIDGCGDQLQDGHEHRRHTGAEQFRDDADILFETVDRIPAAVRFESGPAAAQHALEDAPAQVVAGTHRIVALPGRGGHGADQLEQHHPQQDADMHRERGVDHAGGDVHEALADPHEAQRRGDAHDADQHAEEIPPPDGTGHGAQAAEDLPERDHSCCRYVGSAVILR